MPIRFNQGSTVKACAANSATGAEVDKVAGTTIDRAVLLGGQALANAFGSGEQGGSFGMHEEKPTMATAPRSPSAGCPPAEDPLQSKAAATFRTMAAWCWIPQSAPSAAKPPTRARGG